MKIGFLLWLKRKRKKKKKTKKKNKKKQKSFYRKNKRRRWELGSSNFAYLIFQGPSHRFLGKPVGVEPTTLFIS
jgi:hypothetical protein